MEPEWQYLDSSSALASGIGSYVTLRAPNGKDYSLILETLDTGSSHTISVKEMGGVFAGPIHVWSTDMAARTSSAWFIQQPDILPVDCGYSLTALPNHLYTLTTTRGQGKGVTAPPASAPLSMPYSDDFESYTVGAMPNIAKYFSTVQGAFEVENCAGGRAGKCLEQEITVAPIKWGSVASLDPLTMVGDPGWTDYRVSTDALLEQSGWLELMGRIAAQTQSTGAVQGYHLRIDDAGTWTLFTQDAQMNNATLSTGSLATPLNSWHTLALDFKGTSVTALFDNTPLATITDSTYATGNAGLGVKQWINAQFDNFTVTGPFD